MSPSGETPIRGLVSVIVAFYNAARFLKEAIESVLAQTYTHWELLLVDDGSTDSGADIAREYEVSNSARIHCFAHAGNRNLGMCTSRNLGVRNSEGEYIAVLDADDVWLPRKLDEQVDLMKAHPEVGLVYGHSEYWHDWTGDPQDAQKNYIPPLAPPGQVYHPHELLKLSYPLGKYGAPCPSDFLLRRGVLEQVAGFEEVFDPEHQLYEDQAFLAKTYLNVPVFVAEQCWDKYRLHEDSWGAVSNRLGLSEATRQFYFKWLEQYLRSNGVRDREIWKAVARCTWPYRHRLLAATLKGARRATKQLLRPFLHARNEYS